MVLYQCEKCDYTTNHKHNFNKHLNKKKPCIDKDTIKVTNTEFPHKPSQIPHKSSQIPHFPSQNSNNQISENDCIYCGKTFKRKDKIYSRKILFTTRKY